VIGKRLATEDTPPSSPCSSSKKHKRSRSPSCELICSSPVPFPLSPIAVHIPMNESFTYSGVLTKRMFERLMTFVDTNFNKFEDPENLLLFQVSLSVKAVRRDE
jgi:hypothetical protein